MSVYESFLLKAKSEHMMFYHFDVLSKGIVAIHIILLSNAFEN